MSDYSELVERDEELKRDLEELQDCLCADGLPALALVAKAALRRIEHLEALQKMEE